MSHRIAAGPVTVGTMHALKLPCGRLACVGRIGGRSAGACDVSGPLLAASGAPAGFVALALASGGRALFPALHPAKSRHVGATLKPH